METLNTLYACVPHSQQLIINQPIHRILSIFLHTINRIHEKHYW